jgi:ectoine hydroxylase-related dioxygenase (phytanoyl-CoA dioxygenase family)
MNTQLIANAYASDGVVFIPNALTPTTLASAEEAYRWSLANPGPGASELPSKGTGSFYQDLANPNAFAAYQELLACPEIGDIVAALWGKPKVWFMYEQVFSKSGGTTRRTPWHQDASYLPVQGADLAVMWIAFDPVLAANALEFVRGSHLGVLYDGSSFDINDDTAPLYGDGAMPRLPDIEADRGRWPIVSWATNPGDMVIFHPGLLHGGAATDANHPRRTLSLRFFGSDASVAQRPGSLPVEIPVQNRDTAGNEHPLTRMRGLADGTPFSDPSFPQIRG